MLLRFLRDLLSARHENRGRNPELLRMRKLASIHGAAPVERHVDILFADVKELVAQAHALSDARTPPLKALRRHAATDYLCRYFAHARRLPGRWAECGVFRGTSALSLCLAAGASDPSFDGTGLHLVDSFEGLSEPAHEDRIAGQAAQAPVDRFASPIDVAKHAMRAFPGVQLHKGWIPAVFEELPESAWSFVHIDVDLFGPTLAALEYFYPRLVPGGVIVCDDYGAPTFPGAERAWDRFCGERALSFVMLPTGQSVLLKG